MSTGPDWPGGNFACMIRRPATDSGALRNCSAKSSVSRPLRLPSAPASSTASTAAISAPGRALTSAPIRGHSAEGLPALNADFGSAASTAGSSVIPARTVTAMPIASTGPIQRVAL